MSREVEYNGTTYRWSGDRWLDAATYMPLPGVVQHGKARAFCSRLANKPRSK